MCWRMRTGQHLHDGFIPLLINKAHEALFFVADLSEEVSP